MQIVPGRDPQQWASFNTRFRLLLSPLISTLCFIVVVLGSIYGMKKMIEPQFPELGLPIAALIAFIVQRLNGVSVHFSTRMLAAAFIPRCEKRNLQNQRVAGIDITVGILCLLLTVGICTVDFIANREGNHEAVERMTARPEEKRVDTAPYDQVTALATQARNAERAAEDRERQAWNTRVDAEINRETRRLESRRKHLSGIPDRWAKNEARGIDNKLAGLEIRRRDRKAEFIPKTSNLAEKEKALADIAARQSSLLLGQHMQVTDANARAFGDYQERKESRKGGMFLIYIAAMFLWHICHGIRQYRALKFDEKHPDGESPLIAIFKTIGNGFENALWTIRARIYDWLPEDEIKDATKAAIFSDLHTDVCQAVLTYISQHDGINEMAIYITMKARGFDIADVRHSLRVLKTANLCHENSGLWTADKVQACIIGTSFS